LTSSGIGGSLDSLLSSRDDEMVKMHPFDPASIPNFAIGLKGALPPTCPESIHTAPHLRLMDAGMSNNLPIYPLLRSGRDVDVIIAFDVSSEAPVDNWIKVAGGYAKQRMIKGWPMGAGWPPRTNDEEQTMKELEAAQAAPGGAPNLQNKQQDLGHCTVWVGSTIERDADVEPPPCKPLRFDDEDTHHIKSPDAGIAVVYFPLLANDKVPGVDPLKSDYMSTWNFVYTPEEIDSVVALAKANFEEGKEQTRRTIKAVWERKRDTRLLKEKEAKDLKKRMRLRRGEYLGKKGEGDHFS
jgi:phospholipase A2